MPLEGKEIMEGVIHILQAASGLAASVCYGVLFWMPLPLHASDSGWRPAAIRWAYGTLGLLFFLLSVKWAWPFFSTLPVPLPLHLGIATIMLILAIAVLPRMVWLVRGREDEISQLKGQLAEKEHKLVKLEEQYDRLYASLIRLKDRQAQAESSTMLALLMSSTNKEVQTILDRIPEHLPYEGN